MDPKLRRESLYPRWDFLDKFAVNEYMARSLLVTLVLLAAGQAGVATFLALRPETVRLTLHSRPPIDGVVIIDRFNVKPPPVVPEPRVEIRHMPSSPPAGGTVTVIDGCVGVENWDALGVSGGTGTEAGIAPDGFVDAPDVAGMGRAEAEVWLAVERDPELISIRPTDYPEIAREAGIEGTVIVRVLVGADGFVHAAEVLESVLGLDEAALAAARTAVFRPAEMQGRAVATRIVIPIEFALRGR